MMHTTTECPKKDVELLSSAQAPDSRPLREAPKNVPASKPGARDMAGITPGSWLRIATGIKPASSFGMDNQPTSKADGSATPAANLTTRYSRRMPSRSGWDEYAQMCDSSYRASAGAINAMQLTNIVHLFEFFINTVKIGQCAVAQPRFWKQQRRVFVDTIQLHRSHTERWTEAMATVLRILGPGRYVYGSVWALADTVSEAEFQCLKGVTVRTVKHYNVQAVDYATWPDWDTYRKDMSQNARRNAAKALKSDPTIRIERLVGLAALRSVGRMITMRHRMYQRKGANMPLLVWSAQFLNRLIFLRHYISVSEVIFQGECAAFVVIVQFGNKFFYTEGSSIAENGGSAWFLLSRVIRDTWNACPTGKFVMGCTGPDYRNWASWAHDPQQAENVLRQREQCRVSEFPCRIVAFDYQRAEC